MFVFAVTQVSHGLLEHLTWVGAVEALIMLMAVWWAWIYTAWITNWLDPERVPVRLMLFVLMGLGLIMSSAVPEAFGDRGLVFAVAYMALQLGRTLFILWAVRDDPPLRRNFVRVATWMCGFGLVWIAGGLAEGELRLGLWLLALALDYAAAGVGFWLPRLGRTPTRDRTIEGSHIAHRCGLFIIIALGESILVTGGTFADLDWTGPVLAAFVTALVGSVAMWWIYFGRHADAASEAIATAADPGRMAVFAYTYMPIVVVAGIVVSAVADELVLAHPLGHAEPAVAAAVIAGPALFLLGTILFKFSVFRAWSTSRVVGLLLTLALIPAAGRVTPLAGHARHWRSRARRGLGNPLAGAHVRGSAPRRSRRGDGGIRRRDGPSSRERTPRGAAGSGQRRGRTRRMIAAIAASRSSVQSESRNASRPACSRSARPWTIAQAAVTSVMPSGSPRGSAPRISATFSSRWP